MPLGSPASRNFPSVGITDGVFTISSTIHLFYSTGLPYGGIISTDTLQTAGLIVACPNGSRYQTKNQESKKTLLSPPLPCVSLHGGVSVMSKKRDTAGITLIAAFLKRCFTHKGCPAGPCASKFLNTLCRPSSTYDPRLRHDFSIPHTTPYR